MVGADVQCLFSNVPHSKNCGKYVRGAPKDSGPCAVARNLTEEVELEATTREWENYWSSDWLEAHAAGAQWPMRVEQGM